MKKFSKWRSFFEKKVARFKKFQYLCTEEVRKGQFIPSLKEGVFLPKIDKTKSEEEQMKAEELMIGNWVYSTFSDKPCMVTAIRLHESGYSSVMVNGVEGWKDIASLIPIPITPDILEKNEFSQDKDVKYCARYVYVEDIEKIPQTVVEFSFYHDISAQTLCKCWKKPESCDGENSVHVCDLKHVHELQNVLCLRGFKKEIIL